MGIFDKKKRLNNNSCEIFENPRRQRSVEVYSVRCISSITSTYVTVQIMNNGTLVKADEFKQLSDTRKTIRLLSLEITSNKSGRTVKRLFGVNIHNYLLLNILIHLDPS